MRDIARKQVAKEAITPGEYNQIKLTASVIAHILMPNPDNAETNDNKKMAVVADTATDGFNGTVLEAGSGAPRAIYVFVNDRSGGARVTKGYVFSYYEFVRPMAERMTDDEWRNLVYNPKRASELEKLRPTWYDEFKANTK